MFIPSGPLLLPLPPFVGLAAGARGVLAIPTGPTYNNFQLYCADAGGNAATLAEIVAGIDLIRLTVNAKEKWSLTGAEAVMRAEMLNSGSVANGCLPLFFTEPYLEREAIMSDNGVLLPAGINQDGAAWGTAGLNSVQLEVTVAAGAPGAQVVNMEVLAEQTEPTDLGLHTTIVRHTRNYGAIGTDRITDLPRGKGGNGNTLILTRMHIADANISRIELLADRSRLLFMTRDQLHQQYNHNPAGRRRTPQTGWTHLDFTGFRNRLGDALTTSMRDLELALTFTVAPAAYDILLEFIDAQPQVAA